MSSEILVVFCVLGIILGASSQKSPCPKYFKYNNDGEGGILTIPPPGPGQTKIYSVVAIDSYDNNIPSRGTVLEKSNDDTYQDIVKKKNITLFMTFKPVKKHPILLKVSVNDIVICKQNNVEKLPEWQYYFWIQYPNEEASQKSKVPYIKQYYEED